MTHDNRMHSITFGFVHVGLAAGASLAKIPKLRRPRKAEHVCQFLVVLPNTQAAVKRGKGMFKLPTNRLVIALGALTLAFMAVVSGQDSKPPGDSLAGEIRALKGDINERLDASIRAQLLVARLQLQEQRVNNIVRQLQGVQEQLRANEQARGPLEAGLKTFGGIQTNLPAERQSDMDIVVGPLRTNLEQLAKSDEELRQQQIQLTALLSEEQSRWTLFNGRLEELERTFWKVRR